jgi:hypothetical protein
MKENKNQIIYYSLVVVVESLYVNCFCMHARTLSENMFLYAIIVENVFIV